ncbi:CLUMA_CG017575, isoform A [Clunio marinus]|uniref:CLUMA_CG017575, isoform A n=1 Tax=Clunio marinus TaxID=568069 RepID=A0A1J1IZ99_9DIPT|nr:CLUMA_CG017575, isoform A [Clunio marinus]
MPRSFLQKALVKLILPEINHFQICYGSTQLSNYFLCNFWRFQRKSTSSLICAWGANTLKNR